MGVDCGRLPEAHATGGRLEWLIRKIVNTNFCVLRSGMAWCLLPKWCLLWQAAYSWFARSLDECVSERINHALAQFRRQRARRDALPNAAIILTARASKLPRAAGPQGHDAGKKSRAASAILWSILTEGRCLSSRTALIFRTATAAAPCCKSRAALNIHREGRRR